MTKDIHKDEIEQLKKNIFSDNWELVKTSADRLGEIGGDDVVIFLISLLDDKTPGIRNRAALALEEIKDSRAVEPLLNAIFKKENHNYNGTMVFALESLDCSKKLKEIFKILFYETYESKLGALTILSDQTFDFFEKDLYEIQQMWDDCKLHPETCPLFEDKEVNESMQQAVDSFICYLDKK